MDFILLSKMLDWPPHLHYKEFRFRGVKFVLTRDEYAYVKLPISVWQKRDRFYAVPDEIHRELVRLYAGGWTMRVTRWMVRLGFLANDPNHDRNL